MECRRILLPLVVLSCFSMPAMAVEVEGIHVPERVMVAGQPLHLNGAGVRSKFFIDIYVGALYLSRPAHQAQQAIEDTGPKRVTICFLWSAGRQRLVDGWVKGFDRNQSKEAMARLRPRLDQFIAMFSDVRKGDVYTFDFLPDGSTKVIFQGGEKGRIGGKDFQRALLAVWLGRYPADRSLKEAMLGVCRTYEKSTVPACALHADRRQG